MGDLVWLLLLWIGLVCFGMDEWMDRWMGLHLQKGYYLAGDSVIDNFVAVVVVVRSFVLPWLSFL